MATIVFPSGPVNSGIASNTAGCLMAPGSAQTSTIFGSGSTAGASLLIIYKGTIETFPSFTDRSTRSSDELITFTSVATAGANWSTIGVVSDAYRYIVGKNLTNQAAAASGAATWFLCCRAGTTSLTNKGAMIGTVGLTGSGANLEIPDTNIVASTNYQSAGFYINFPQSWTV